MLCDLVSFSMLCVLFVGPGKQAGWMHLVPEANKRGRPASHPHFSHEERLTKCAQAAFQTELKQCRMSLCDRYGVFPVHWMRIRIDFEGGRKTIEIPAFWV